MMDEGRQNNPISTHEHSQDPERDPRDENQVDESKGRNVLVRIAKLGIVILLLCTVAPVAGILLFALILSGGSPDMTETIAVLGGALLLVILAIVGSKKWGLTIGVVALLALVVVIPTVFR